MNPAARILCVGVSTLDQIFKVQSFPVPGEKTRAVDFIEISGGNAGNAAIAAARLGGQVLLSSPVGDDRIGAAIRQYLESEGIDCSRFVVLPRAMSSLSAIVVDRTGERTIVSRRGESLDGARLADADALTQSVRAVLIDNRFPEFSLGVAVAARRHNVPVVLDADNPTRLTAELFAASTHIIFSAHGLRETAHIDDPQAALQKIAAMTDAYLSVTGGNAGAWWLHRGRAGRENAFAVEAIDTLGAGDVYHGAFALALAEGQDEASARRFSAAAAALKCTRFGGIAGSPSREELEAFLSSRR
ncbi:MAG TPA: PfkB family carbohydrate kinase [Pseudorhodoplanes sp.]|nr:PfkB family carbohydrate kinase [Pseudorhodoplanes sp.]